MEKNNYLKGVCLFPVVMFLGMMIFSNEALALAADSSGAMPVQSCVREIYADLICLAIFLGAIILLISFYWEEESYEALFYKVYDWISGKYAELVLYVKANSLKDMLKKVI